MFAGVAALVGLTLAATWASPEDVSGVLRRLGDADLVLLSDPAGARPVRVLLATRVDAPVERLRQILADPSSYAKAMPSFRRVEVMSKHERGPDETIFNIAWELEVPISNLKGKLSLRAQDSGVDLTLTEGDFAPGLFHLDARKDKGGDKQQALLTIEGFANVRETNWATRQIVQRSPIAEPAITVAAAYVMVKSLARLAEGASPARPTAAMTASDLSTLNGATIGLAANAFAQGSRVLAAVLSRTDGRLARVEVAVHVPAAADQVARRAMQARPFVRIPGWKKITPVGGNPDECKDTSTLCWKLDTNLPIFSLDGTWRIWPKPWRARLVAGDTKGAILGIDIIPAKPAGHSTLVLSQHPRLDLAGYVARKLIAAEPLLEHGLALALTLVDAIALGPALAKD